MHRSLPAALTVLVLLAGTMLAADNPQKKNQNNAKPENVTVTRVDAAKGEITVRYTDAQGKAREKTFQLTKDVRLLDETGRVVNLAVFESGSTALVIESEGKLRELRRTPNQGQPRRLSDAVRTLIEMTDCTEGCTADLQTIYDMLRKLDTGNNGKIDAKALKAAADRILEERVREAFNRLDANQDGKISKEEARGLIREHFDQIDSNKDGFISFDELTKAAKERREHKAQSKDQPQEKEKK